MTTLCPNQTPKSCTALFSSMDRTTGRFQALAPANGHLTLLDLETLRPLIEQAEPLAFLVSLLSPIERERFQQFAYAKRRLEWMGGRLAAKRCLHALFSAHFPEHFRYDTPSFVADAHGRPCLDPPLDQYPHASVSISHSQRYAAAIIRQAGACGIDIQHKTPKLASVRERFATDGEMRLVNATDALTGLGLLWVAKEAVKKCLLPAHPSFFGAIRVAEVRFDPGEHIWTARCCLTDPAPLPATVRMVEFEEYFLACAYGETNA